MRAIGVSAINLILTKHFSYTEGEQLLLYCFKVCGQNGGTIIRRYKDRVNVFDSVLVTWQWKSVEQVLTTAPMIINLK